MKTQRLVTGTSLPTFENSVANYLRDGWKVVPGTMTISVFCAPAQTPDSYRTHFVEERYAVVVEK